MMERDQKLSRATAPFTERVDVESEVQVGGEPIMGSICLG